MAEKVDIWMPFYPADYLASTMHLTCEESGAYLHLLFHSWKVGPLPKDTEQLRRIARVEKAPWRVVWAALRGFWQETADGFIQLRLERERAEWAERKASQVAKAKDAAERRWSKRKQCSEDASSNAPSIPASIAPSSASSTPPGNASGISQAMLGTCPSSSSLSISTNTPPTPSQARGREKRPVERVDRAKHVASERTIGMSRPPTPERPAAETQRSAEEQAMLEREVEALFAKPERRRREAGELERISPPATLTALRQHLARPDPTDAVAAGRAMLQHLYALFQAQFNKPSVEGDLWEDSLVAWQRCFEPVSVGDVEMDGESTVVYLLTPRPRDLADGLAKFQQKVRTAMNKAFGREVQIVPRDAGIAA